MAALRHSTVTEEEGENKKGKKEEDATIEHVPIDLPFVSDSEDNDCFSSFGREDSDASFSQVWHVGWMDAFIVGAGVCYI